LYSLINIIFFFNLFFFSLLGFFVLQ